MKDPGVVDYRDQISKCLTQDTTTYKEELTKLHLPIQSSSGCIASPLPRKRNLCQEKNEWYERMKPPDKIGGICGQRFGIDFGPESRIE